MKEKNKFFKRLVIFAIAATMCMAVLAVLPTASADDPPLELLPIPQNRNIGMSGPSLGLLSLQSQSNKLAADWVMGNQDPTGWFPWTSGGGVYYNIQGPPGRGMLKAYEISNDVTYLNSAISNGDYIINTMLLPSTGLSLYSDGDPRFSTHDPLFLEELSQVTGDSSYADFVQIWFWDKFISGTYGEANDMDASDFGNYVVDARAGQGIVALSPWDISATAIAAYIAGETSIANDLIGSILYGLEQTTATDTTYDSIGLAGAVWASAVTGVDLDPTVGVYASCDSTADLATTLSAMRTDASPKGWLWSSAADPSDYTNGDTQTTTFAIMALDAFDRTTYDSYVTDGVAFMRDLQQATGEYLAWPTASPGGSGNVEVNGESISGIVTVAPSEVYVDDDWVSNSPGDSVGGHVYSYDAFSTIIDGIDAVTVGGTVNVAAGTYTNDLEDTSLPMPQRYRITKSITLLGAQAGNDPAGSIDRGGESILVRTDGLPYSLYAPDITIDGFMIGSSAPNTGCRLIISDVATDTTITNCIIKNTPSSSSGHGVYIYPGGTGATISYNTFYNTAWEAIAGSSVSDAEISYNHISASGQHAIQLMGHAGSNNVITHNHFSSISSKNAVQYWGGPDLEVSYNTIIGGNTMYDGIWLDNAADNSVVTNNEISDTIYAGINIRGDCTNVDVMYNDISGCGTGIEKHAGDVTGVIITENNIYGNSMGVVNYNSVSIDATCNWWGNCGGPTHSSNPLGVGDTVSDYVDYLPWLDATYPGGSCIGGLCQTEVWVDDDFTSATPRWNIDHFATIQAGIDRLCVGGTVYVEDGNYHEYVIVHVQDVTVQAVNPPTSTAIIYGTVDITADGVTFENFKVMPTVIYSTDEAAIGVYASDVVVNNNIVDGITGDGSGYFTIKGIHVYSSSGISNIDLTNNIIQNVENQGTSTAPYGGADGIMIQGVIDGVDVFGNTIEDIHSAGWAYGIEVTPTASAPSNPPQNIVILENNILSVNDGSVYDVMADPYSAPYPGVGFSLDETSPGAGDGDASEVIVNCNSFANTPYGAVNKDPSHILDAECNWWDDCTGPYDGTLNPGGLGCNVLGLVDFDPWVGKVVADAGGPYYNEDEPYTIHFDGSYNTPGCCGEVVTIEWDFDDSDGIQVDSTDVDPTHNYPDENGYTATLTITTETTIGSLTHICSKSDTAIVNVRDDPPIVQLEYPRGGEELSGTINIQWFALDSEDWGSPSIWLYYTADGGDSWVRIAKNLENTIGDGAHKDRGEYSWSAGSLPDGNYKVRIYAYDTAGNLAIDTSDPFAINNHNSGLLVSYVTVSSNYVKNDDSLEIKAGIAQGTHLTAEEITADLSGLGKGTSVPADSFDGLTATWDLTNVVCTPSDGPITITVTAGDESKSATITADNTLPELTVIKPENALYFFNAKLFALNKPIIIGAITLEATAYDSSGVQKTEIYIDDELKETLTGGSEWYMNLRLMGRHTLKIVAYDNAGNIYEYSQTVIIINPFGEK